MSVELSVILPTHDPREDYLDEVLAGLEAQTLGREKWALLVVDNRSTVPLAPRIDLRWHPSAEVLREEALGLTRARLAGFRRAWGNLFVLVDDDFVLSADYLERTIAIARENRNLGAWSGSIVPRFERKDLAPPLALFPLLTLREVESDLWSNDPDHHASTPWGAGLCVRRAVAEEYERSLTGNPLGFQLDLQGKRLLYGGDTDISYAGCRIGLGKGVFADLRGEHLIPASRCGIDYLTRVAAGRGYSEVLHHLVRTGSLPSESGSIGGWLRAQRAVRTGSKVERAANRARLAGRRQALTELASSGARATS